jgi:UDP-2,4-diacetamido-2,4,6-trideoxy-beta-L-altropyranose hydrolase
MSDRPRAVFRCDASAALGGGHVSRCLTLARALRDRGWSCAFAVSVETAAAVPRLHGAADAILTLGVAAADEAARMADRFGGEADLLVVDHYARDMAFETACRRWTRRVLVIDDLADRRHDADLVLDQTLGRSPFDYAGLVPPHCRVLAGSGYALLHPAFAANRPAALSRREGCVAPRRILVAFGATDPGNATSMALRAIAASRLALEVDVILGAGAPHRKAVRAELTAMPHPTRLHVEIEAESVAALMTAADLAIGAGGTTSWERCCLGLPTVVLETAANQRAVVRALVERRAAVFAGQPSSVSVQAVARVLRHVALDVGSRARMARAAAQVCDGRGVARVLDAALLPESGVEQGIRLRPATIDDAEQMFIWQTHPSTRRHSFTPEPPSWGEHLRWLCDRLADPRCLLRVVLLGDQPVGSVRLNRRAVADCPDGYEVSIAIAPECRRLGIGKAALILASELIPHLPLVARIKPENEASQRLFSMCGYRPFAAGVFVRWPDGDGRNIPGRERAPGSLL